MAKIDVLTAGLLPANTFVTLAEAFVSHRIAATSDAEFAATAPFVRGMARGAHFGTGREVLEQMPKLEIIANFGVGYDGIDLKYAAERGIIVTNTPDVLTEEVADTALGLLLMTVRELSAAERHLRAGRWKTGGNYPLTATLRDRTVGIVGLGRIGLAIARRLDAMKVPVVYHTRRPRADVSYRHYADLKRMAADVDTLIVVVPGTAETANMVDASVLQGLGSRGIVINVGRGTAIDDHALVAALRNHTILAAGLDVFAKEPDVPEGYLGLDNVVLLPHVGSASAYTRDAMGQLVVDNLVTWFEQGRPLTPVPETPWPRKT